MLTKNKLRRRMRILHVLSYNPQLTGSWFYARDIAEESFSNGHSVSFCADSMQIVSEGKFFPVPISKRSVKHRLLNICKIYRIIKKHQIDIVHAHSRAASWVSFFASRLAGAPLISTIHGKQHIHTSVYFNIYGDELIAVSKTIYDQLVYEFKYDRKKVSEIPNGIKFKSMSSGSGDNKNSISIIGRTNGPKGEILRRLVYSLFHTLLCHDPALKLNLIGGELNALGEDTVKYIEDLNAQYNERIRYHGFVNELEKFYRASKLVIGAGRVAIEALYHQTPVIAVGEAEYIGLVTDKNFDNAVATNFGDIGVHDKPDITVNTIVNDIEEAGRQNKDFQSQIAEIYGIGSVYKKVMEKYKKARMRRICPRGVPALMYHKVCKTEINTKNRIFITERNLERHFLQLKCRGFTPITFETYEKFREGIMPVSDFPQKPVFLTFDDGYEDNYTILFPLLKKYGFTCTIFVLGQRDLRTNIWDESDKELRSGLLSDDQILEMRKWGIEFGSHSMDHPHLTRLSETEAEKQIIRSKSNLERLLGEPVNSFCYPYGETDDRIKKIVEKAGYRYGISTDSGGMHIEDDPFQIFRAYIFPHDGMWALYKKSSSWYRKHYLQKRGK